MGHGAERKGLGAWGIAQRAWRMGHSAWRKGLGAWGREIFEFRSRNAASDELRRDKGGKTEGEKLRRWEGRQLGNKQRVACVLTIRVCSQFTAVKLTEPDVAKIPLRRVGCAHQILVN